MTTGTTRAKGHAAQPGYWCECITHTPAVRHGSARLATFSATSPTQAIRWIRVAVRTIASSLEPDAFHDAWDWVTHRHTDSIHALSHGKPCTFSVTHAQTRVEWTARPVTFLPLLHRPDGTPPACIDHFHQWPASASDASSEPDMSPSGD